MLRLAVDNTTRPRTRGECIDGPRPCPWESCRYHLEHAEESCALDVADRGEHELTEVGDLVGLSASSVHATIKGALATLAIRAAPLRDLLGRPGKALSLEDKILGVLEDGPESSAILADRFDVTRETADNALARLRARGLVRATRGFQATWSLVAKEAA